MSHALAVVLLYAKEFML